MQLSGTSFLSFQTMRGAGIAQLVVLGLAVHSVVGSILLWGHFPVEGIFPLELTWVQAPFPPKNSFGWEYKPRSSLCTHAFHRTDSKDHDVHVLEGECRQQKHNQHALSTKTECDYLNGWIKKRSHTQKSHPKVMNPRDIAGERKKKKKKKKKNPNHAKWCVTVGGRNWSVPNIVKVRMYVVLL